MHWSIYVLFALAPVLIVGLALLVVNTVSRRTGGYAPGWQLRCTKCGRTRDAAEAGIVRIGATSVAKRVLAYCNGCRRFRMVALERKPASEQPTAATQRA